MERAEFIRKVAAVAVKDWEDRHLVLPSIVIAQAMKESGCGTSELAVNANAIFGIKKNGWTGPIYIKDAGEQNGDGIRRIDSDVEWRAYGNWDESIIDHNTYIAKRKVGNQSEPNFGAMIGESNVKKAIAGLVGDQCRHNVLAYINDSELREYVACGTTEFSYATSLTYPQSLLDDYINKYNLTQYDQEKKMIVNVHAGHNPDGMTACGAVGLINESTEARRVKDLVISLLQAQGHIVRDCTCNDGSGQSDVLKKIVIKCNEVSADINISIHFNAGARDGNGNGVTTGCECFVFPGSIIKQKAAYICSKISALGYKNRGVKESNSLYVLKNTKAPTILVECCFVDDKDDCQLYNPGKIAEAVVEGITGIAISQNTPKKDTLYRVQVGTYRSKENAEQQAKKIMAAGFDCYIIQ